MGFLDELIKPFQKEYNKLENSTKCLEKTSLTFCQLSEAIQPIIPIIKYSAPVLILSGVLIITLVGQEVYLNYKQMKK